MIKRKYTLNPARIIALYKKGLSYRLIGILISKECGRSNAYKADSCSQCINRYKKGIIDENGIRIKQFI